MTTSAGHRRPLLGLGIDSNRPSHPPGHGPRSIPPSRSSSLLPPTRASTPGYASSVASSSSTLPTGHIETSRSASGSSAHAPHSGGGLSKLRHMFEQQKHAVFEAHVTIHELGNVPQLHGQFDIKWKFRGKKPKTKELTELHKDGPLPHKPSLPNLRHTGPTSLLASSSSTSLRSTSTSSSSAYPPTPRSTAHPATSSRPLKAMSFPPLHDKSEKKTSDSTPLKQVIEPEQNDTDHAETVESPQSLVDEPAAMEETGAAGNRSRGASGSSRQSTQSIPPQINIHRPSVPNSLASSRNVSGASIPNQRSALSYPRDMPPIRSGTNPSYSTLLDPIPGTSDTRTPINRSMTSSTIATSASVVPSSRPMLTRLRSHTVNSRDAERDIMSEARKGTTPTHELHSHVCKFDYELNHTIRIPLGKPAPQTAPNGYPYRSKTTGPALPILGTGPLSESGLRLVIEQLPSSAIKDSPPSTDGIMDEALSTAIAVVHQADKKDHTPTESGIRKESREKTVFGIVDVDLAAFAGKGKMTRRFLLRGSRTNATIKLSVEMRWVGGEEQWAAPPMQEGHHVAGVGDLVGTEVADAMRSDLGLSKTPSNSSSGGSSTGLERTRTNYSSGSVYPSRNHSDASLVPTSLPSHQYQSYEHHLLKPETPPRGRTVKYAGTSGDRGRSKSHSPASGQSSPRHGYSPVSSKLGPSPIILSMSKVHHHHRHHTHHMRGQRRTPSRSGIHDLPPEVIIEAIFNPHPASVEGPFTYVPEGPGQNDLAGEKEVLDQVVKDAGGEVDGEGYEPEHGDEADSPHGDEKDRGKHRLGWRIRGRTKGDKGDKRDKRERQNTVSSMGG
ncbi:hypothetical protein IAU60_005514 [Kwoniella sp. DSM 27419]